MKIFFLILILASSAFALVQYSAESSTFAINVQNENTYSAISQTFPINYIDSNLYYAESDSFLLTGFDDVPEPILFINCYLLFIIYYLKERKF